MLKLRAFGCGYGEVPILRQVDLQLHGGEILGILGKNGSGKSTLFRALIGEADVQSGTVAIGGQEVPRRLSSDLRARRFAIGYLPQGSEVIRGLSVRENLELAAWRSRSRALRRQAVAAVLARRPYSRLQRHLRRPSADLSGGQRLLLSLASLTLAESRILLMDEPFVGLDEHASQDLRGELLSFKKAGISAILIEQSVPLLQAIADRLAYLVPLEGMEQAGTMTIRIVGGEQWKQVCESTQPSMS